MESSPKCMDSENFFGDTALHAAARSGNPKIVQLPLHNSADPNKTNHRGSTALHIECFLPLNETNNNVSVDPYTKIAAILLCKPTLVIDIQDINSYTPLHIAGQRGCYEMVKLLIDSGASLTAKTRMDSKGQGGRTPEGMAKFGRHDATADIIKQMAKVIERGEAVVMKKKAFVLIG
ncbi:hypothetical protein HJC23_007611 [Cyclotella cryptica]|uniref:Ankyrin n=1 Tax=Cyclotella cryptica TaxID=29204 RepID=A0ABD3QRN0_9STRA